ncbi:DUF6883 domain-containing protein [Anaerosinus massiliensis]|uniref:DUF6883 domain-containing protein n=1 Tax=Massilibacillus massiliensis TaxID=1806837 RepID=UPI000A5A0710|nr:DUF6883 domain-containing protein [Massilibacillus massiliensis]
MYYVGKTLGDVAFVVGGTLVTITGAGGTIIISPTGVGAIAGATVTAYAAGATANGAYNFSKDFSKIFSSNGASKAVAKNPLPNMESAKIDPRKLTDYALNPEHPVGGNKAKVFESALGYNKSNADALMKQVQEKLPQSEAILGKADQYGQRYTVDMQITGPNGNTATVRTGWIFKPGSTTPEMTTIYVK